MRISIEQERLINGWSCERLSSCMDNLRLVDEFYCRRNESLAFALQNEAFEDDECGRTAYYVVKDESNRIMFYFSLKTGLLYDQHIDEKSIKIFKKLNDYVRDAISRQDLTKDQMKALNGFLEKVRTHKGVTKEDLEQLPQGNKSLFEELESELNLNITHVGKTYSGVELVHFCKNNAMDEVIRNFRLPRNFGEVVFWKFIVPKIVEARELIGIQYFFLFAADMTAENKLVQYYSDFLHFQLDDARATVKPVYDFACRFMYQDAEDLDRVAEEFWENFNEEDEV